MRCESAALLVAAMFCAPGVAASPALGSKVRIVAPATLVAGKPCRVAVAVAASGGVRGTAVLQERTGKRWRPVSSAQLPRRRSVTLRCPTVERPGRTLRLRALIRRDRVTVARSRTVSIRVVSPAVVAPAPRPGPVPAPPSPPGPRSR